MSAYICLERPSADLPPRAPQISQVTPVKIFADPLYEMQDQQVLLEQLVQAVQVVLQVCRVSLDCLVKLAHKAQLELLVQVDHP